MTDTKKVETKQTKTVGNAESKTKNEQTNAQKFLEKEVIAFNKLGLGGNHSKHLLRVQAQIAKITPTKEV